MKRIGARSDVPADVARKAQQVPCLGGSRTFGRVFFLKHVLLLPCSIPDPVLLGPGDLGELPDSSGVCWSGHLRLWHILVHAPSFGQDKHPKTCTDSDDLPTPREDSQTFPRSPWKKCLDTETLEHVQAETLLPTSPPKWPSS